MLLAFLSTDLVDSRQSSWYGWPPVKSTHFTWRSQTSSRDCQIHSTHAPVVVVESIQFETWTRATKLDGQGNRNRFLLFCHISFLVSADFSHRMKRSFVCLRLRPVVVGLAGIHPLLICFAVWRSLRNGTSGSHVVEKTKRNETGARADKPDASQESCVEGCAGNWEDPWLII